jgi:diguanylate cyclase
MGLFSRKKNLPPDSPEALADELSGCREARLALLHVSQSLLIFLKDFSFDFKEIGCDEFKAEMDALAETLVSETITRKMASAFEDVKPIVVDYIAREKTYLREKETELKNIIDLLTKGLAVVNAENTAFNSRMHDQSERIERITLLDDMKRIKGEIKVEVEQMQRVVLEKQEKDNQQIETLSRRVSALSKNLEKAKTASLTDGLTGLYNRAAFDRCIKKLADAGTLNNAVFSLLMMDIDNFKIINDTYGHQTGDRVLMAMAQKCKAEVRKEDFLARYGGEEFSIVLPGVPLKAASKKAAAICKSIASRTYKLNDENRKDVKIAFTISIGVGQYKKGDTVGTLIERADKALYAAKHSGKNRVVTEGDAIPGVKGDAIPGVKGDATPGVKGDAIPQPEDTTGGHKK